MGTTNSTFNQKKFQLMVKSIKGDIKIVVFDSGIFN